MFFRPKRISDVTLAICIPTSVFLFCYVTLLTKNLQKISEDVVETEVTGVLGNAEKRGFFSSHVSEQSLINEPINNTGKCRQDLLLLTTILRSGSVTLKKVLSQLRKENEFQIISSPPKKAEVIHLETKEEQKSTASKMSSVNFPAVILNTVAFINFTKFNLLQPIQISMVRDPVERAISWYYYDRAPYEILDRHKLFPEVTLPSRQFLKKSLESCLADPLDEECNYVSEKERIGHTLEFFCGHESFCKLFGSKDGLKRAKEVVESSFSVVGVLEDIEKTLFVLEHFVPRFFKGAYKLYTETIVKDEANFNRNIFKPELETSYRKRLSEKLSVEKEFYDFLRQRLNRQYEAILDRYIERKKM